MTTKLKVPKLRFKEFSGEWKKIKFSDIPDKSIKWSLTGGPFGSDLKTEHYTNEGIRIIQLQNIGDGVFLDEYKIFTSEFKANLLLSCNIYPGDIILSKMGDPVARACIMPDFADRYLMASDGIRLVPNKEEFDFKFVHDYINYYIFRKEANNNSTGSTRKRIGLTELKNLPFIKPSLSEQQKIASFLGSIDEKIEKIKEKKKSLEEYKKGVMQKIFSQELRFKDESGEEFGEWEEKKLGEIGETFNGLTGKTGEDFGIGKSFITYKQIFDNSKINTSKFALVSINSGENQNKVKYGDIFFTVSSETPQEVGMSAVLLDEIQEDLYLNSFCFGFRVKSFDILSPEFARFYFRYQYIRKKIIILAQGSTRYNISKNEMMKIKINLPTLKEQEKIADFLSGIYEKIEKVSDELGKMEEFKKGLLQGVFM